MKKILYSIMALAISAFTLQSCEDVPAPYDIPGEGGNTETPEVELVGDGTLENPYNAAAANAVAAALPAESVTDHDVYIKGKIYSVKEEFGTQHGNASFYITDDGVSGEQFYVFRTLYLGNKKYTSGENIKEGDEVIICGKLTNYKGNTPETFQNGSYLYSLNGKTGDNGGSDTPAEGEYINETFATSFGTFTVKTIKGQEWIIDFSTAKASGYVNKQNIESESYLVSPAIDLSNSKEACLSFEYILAYANNAGDNKVLITDNYNEASPASSSWEDITGTFAEYKDWNTFHKYSKAIPAKYIGKKNVRIAFYYNASATGSKTWEVRNVILKEGKPDADDNTGGGGNDDTGGDNTTPDEGSLLSNGTFEAWSGGQPVNWKTATTAGNASLKQSTDAHSGQYSVSVGYVASSNKRLGYKETELEAGKYVFSFWAKATKGGKSQTRPGYVPVTDGKVGNYVYGDYANLSTDWTQVTYEFELKEKTTICLVIMNPKGSNYSESQDILIDDAKLVKQ